MGDAMLQRELRDFVALARELQSIHGGTMAQARVEAARLLQVVQPTDEAFNRALWPHRVRAAAVAGRCARA